MVATSTLHLDNLTIEGFRGMDRLTIPRLGRVTLLAGKNGVGKSTVLDALRILATRGHYPILVNLLRGRDELTIALDEDGDETSVPDWSSIFNGRQLKEDARVAIGPIEGPKLFITLVDRDGGQMRLPGLEGNESAFAIKFEYRDDAFVFSWQLAINEYLHVRRPPVISQSFTRPLGTDPDHDRFVERVNCESVGPGVISNSELARLWDTVVLTDEEDRAIQVLRLVFGNDLARVAFKGDLGVSARRGGRRPAVQLRSTREPVPLRSLGDGAVRLFGLALALANAKDGFLLIDEVENGIHHTLHFDLWRIIFKTAQRYNVQVVATTHSWDCIRGFAYAADENESADGILVRIQRSSDGLKAVTYSEENLLIAAEQGIEAR